MIRVPDSKSSPGTLYRKDPNMSTTHELPGLLKVAAAPEVKPLNEAVWQAWLQKGRAQEERGSVARMAAVKWLAIAALLASGVLWSDFSTYDLAVKFIVAAAAVAVMFQAVRLRNYAIAVLFGAVAVSYNPVVSLFEFSGGWERVLVFATVIP